MKHTTPTDARRNWFRLLDEIADGEVVVLERKGRRIVLQREDRRDASVEDIPDYGSLIRVPDADRADSWGWEWSGSGADLVPIDKSSG
jgi:antitoxin (DNA-binding transcriptional repressor) of toxin-antitoxin stability system